MKFGGIDSNLDLTDKKLIKKGYPYGRNHCEIFFRIKWNKGKCRILFFRGGIYG